MADTSSSRVTFSLTRTPPASRAAFQLTPQSLRLTAVAPSNPIRSFPKGSVAAPVSSKSTVTGLVTPLIVRSPVTAKRPSPAGWTEVETNVISGCCSMSKKSLLRRWASRSALRVSMLAASMRSSRWERTGSSASK
jgi:hypothetical protein